MLWWRGLRLHRNLPRSIQPTRLNDLNTTYRQFPFALLSNPLVLINIPPGAKTMQSYSNNFGHQLRARLQVKHFDHRCYAHGHVHFSPRQA
jgi:hypothetical protein